LTKPFSLDQVEHAIERALETQRLRNEVRGLRDTLGLSSIPAVP